MADDISSQLISKLKSSLRGMFSIRLDKSTDISNVSHLKLFVRWASVSGIEETILFCSLLQSATRAADILPKVDDYFKKSDLKWENLCSVLYRRSSCFVETKSAAWRSGSERRFYDDHDRKVDGSPPNLVSLLRPWIRCFTMIISAWWNLASSKLKKSKENSSGKLGNKGNS